MSNGITRAALVGALSGVRSMAGIAAVSRGLAERPECAHGITQRMFAHARVSQALTLAAIGEAVADKLPVVGARTDPLPLAGRIAFGALAAATVTDTRRGSPLAAACVGAITAFGAAHLAYQLRTRLAAEGRPGPLLGMAEDIIVLEGASQVVGSV